MKKYLISSVLLILVACSLFLCSFRLTTQELTLLGLNYISSSTTGDDVMLLQSEKDLFNVKVDKKYKFYTLDSSKSEGSIFYMTFRKDESQFKLKFSLNVFGRLDKIEIIG